MMTTQLRIFLMSTWLPPSLGHQVLLSKWQKWVTSCLIWSYLRCSRRNKAEIISSPRLVTTDKKMAYIEQGTEIPYLEAASSGAVSVSFKKAVLSLMVTPQITSDGNLVLDLIVTQDKKGDVVQTGTGEAMAIDTQRIGTQVLVANGETVVLGGIYQHEFYNDVRKVPVLGDLPVLGALFRHKLEEMGKKELLIFVTPKIVYQ